MMEGNNNRSRKERRLVSILVMIIVAMLAVIIALLYSLMNSDGTLDPNRPTERITANIQLPADTQADQGQDRTNDTDVRAENEGQGLTSEEAKQIALKDAGLKESEVRMSRVKFKWDDGIQVYDVEFYSDWIEYEYNVDAMTGEILEKEIEN